MSSWLGAVELRLTNTLMFAIAHIGWERVGHQFALLDIF
jgi:hypothetical protein